ncbi:MAG: type II toxin-antitoxin system VapC family toxin [Gammaproteobacteria bacterium]|nr:type II toxin-antitoxin system VapC family toxin [Gammaproteobacteria bacterium]
MSNLVLDASVSLAWLLDDETAPQADAASQLLATHNAYVPRIWHLEMRNALLVAERRGRLSRRMSEQRLEALAELPIRTDPDPNFRAAMDLARKHGITFYDALYLELALRITALLATLDKALARAAADEGLNVLAV